MPESNAAERSSPEAPVGTPQEEAAAGAVTLPNVEWSSRAGSRYRLGMTIWPVLREVRFDLFEGDRMSARYEYVCSNLSVEGARALRDNLDQFLAVCEIKADA